MRWTGLAVLFGLTIGAGNAEAQDSERFRLEKTQQGYIRMESATGAMSLCSEDAGKLVCQAAQDHRAFPPASPEQNEIDRLRLRLEAMEKRLTALEAERSTSLPGQEEFDRGLDQMERFFRRFMGIIQEFEPKTDSPAPDRT